MDKRLGADRAGFEPRRACGFAQEAPEYKRPGLRRLSMEAAPTARLKSGAE